jgi:hypothetical protein
MNLKAPRCWEGKFERIFLSATTLWRVRRVFGGRARTVSQGALAWRCGRGVIVPSRNDGDFSLILSELDRKTGLFARCDVEGCL